MAQYFAGNSLAAFLRTSITSTEVTTSGKFDSAYVSSAIYLSATGATITSPVFSASGTLWVRFDHATSSLLNANADELLVVNGATNVFRIRANSGSNIYALQYWDGSAWAGSSTLALITSTLYTMCLKIVLGTSWELFQNNISVGSGAITGTPPTAATQISLSAAQPKWVSQIMIADYDIRDSHILAAAINGNSASNTGGSGTYTDINEVALNDATAETITVSGNKMGQTKAAITVPSGFDIKGMVLAGRVRASGTITDAKFGIRSGGTNYSSSALVVSAAYEPRVVITALDPATGADFTQSGFNNAEPYFEAV